MELLLLPLSLMGALFITLPLAALGPAALFGWLYYRYRTWTGLLSAVLWLLYSLYESGMYLRILCSGECNIRIDLLIIYPLLILITLIALTHTLIRIRLGKLS